MLAAVITRLQRYATGGRRRAFADALVLASALKAGPTVLTANIADFDLLQQPLPDVGVAFYRRVRPGPGVFR